MSELLVERREFLMTLTMNRPERLNAVTETLYEQLVVALAEADSDQAVRCVVLTGAGRAFCVGADLKNHGEGPSDRARNLEYAMRGQDAAQAVMDCKKPVVAAVNGHAIGAGLELALACDLSVVADDAKLRFPELALGTFVGGGTTFTLVERVGMTRARELLLLGQFFGGSQAAAWQLCNRSAPAAEVLAEAQAMASEVASQSPRSVAYAKALLRSARDRSISQVLVGEAGALAACMGTKDWQEGIDAFREKRSPEFTGD